ncbi:hypothetical protein T484DRAFT_1753853 [Baffinella frigidus]|nr:hypothetical protein T484DRAFT_1753853 [Cryptophyta sp. CCMP2293]
MGPYRATAGKYWLGDLSTVLSADLWQEIGGKQGNITLSDGRTVVLFKLPDGAGVYPGKDGNNHLIDSGTVGVTLLKGLCIEAQTTGQTIVYNKTFECLSVTVAHPQGGGMVSFNTFGHSVTIHSDDQVYSMKQFLSEGLAAQQHATRLRAEEWQQIQAMAGREYNPHASGMGAMTQHPSGMGETTHYTPAPRPANFQPPYPLHPQPHHSMHQQPHHSMHQQPHHSMHQQPYHSIHSSHDEVGMDYVYRFVNECSSEDFMLLLNYMREIQRR